MRIIWDMYICMFQRAQVTLSIPFLFMKNSSISTTNKSLKGVEFWNLSPPPSICKCSRTTAFWLKHQGDVMMSVFLQDLVMLLVLEDSKDYDIRDTSVLCATSWPNSHDERHDDSFRKVPIQSRRSQKSRINKWHRSWPQQLNHQVNDQEIEMEDIYKYKLKHMQFPCRFWVKRMDNYIKELKAKQSDFPSVFQKIWCKFDANFGHLHPKAPNRSPTNRVT